MKPGLKALAILLLFAGLVLVNYLAANLPLRLDATAGKIYTLTPGTRAILARVGEPITLDFYFSRDSASTPIQVKNYADQVLEMLHQYVRASGGRITLNVINPEPDTPEEEKAAAAGLQPINSPDSGGDPVYFGLAATQADKHAALPSFSSAREQLLEYDLSLLISDVGRVDADKPKLGLITSLPLQGTSPQETQMMMMMQQQPKPGQYVATEWAHNFNLQAVQSDADKLPDNLDALAVIHPQNLSPKLQFAIDQFILSGKPVFLAVDPSSQYFKRQGGQQMMMGGPQPGVSSDLPLLLNAYGIGYNAQAIVGDPLNSTKVRTSRTGAVSDMPTWLSLDKDSGNAQSPATAQLKSFFFVEAGSFNIKAAPGVTVTPLIETSDQAGDLQAAMLQFAPPDEIARQITPSGKKTIAAVLQGKFKTAFPDGPPKDPAPAPDAPKPAEAEKKAATQNPEPKTQNLTESKSSSTLLVVADTDWLFDDFIFDPDARQAGYLMPRNDDLDFADNALDFLTGSTDLLSIRGKMPAQRPFKVVQEMEATARKKFDAQLTALEARLNEVQTKLSALQTKKTEGGRLVATPEMQKAIDDFRTQQAGIKSEQRDIRRTLREDIDSLGRRLLWINLLATPLAVGCFGLWFHRSRRRA